MIIDIKYHIASLVAVFLALGIGILVGTSIIGNDGMAERQQQIITVLEQDFAHLRKDNAKKNEEIKVLSEEIQQSESFEEELLPALVPGRLVGRSIVVVETGNNFMTKEIKDLIKSAGGDIRSRVAISPKIADVNELNQEQILAVLGQELGENESLSQVISRKIGNAIITTENMDLLMLLKDLDLIKIEGDFSKPPETVVVMGGSEKEDDEKIARIDLPLIRTLKEKDIRVIGAEFSTDRYSYMRSYQKENMTTIDHLDTIPGQLALILTLQGEEGHFGNKKTAEKLIPELKW